MARSVRTRCGSVVVCTAFAAVAVAALVLMAPAFACTLQAQVEVKPTRADPGAVVRVEGHNFERSGGPVNVYLGSESGGPLLATATPTNGAFAVDVQVPSNLAPNQDYLVLVSQPESSVGHYGTALLHPTLGPAGPATGSPPPAAPAAAAAPVVEAEPAPAPVAAEDPVSQPVDRSGFSSSGAPAFSNAGRPVAPLVTDERKAFGGQVGAGGIRTPWVLLPLGVLGLTLFAAAGAAFVRQVRTEGVRVPV